MIDRGGSLQIRIDSMVPTDQVRGRPTSRMRRDGRSVLSFLQVHADRQERPILDGPIDGIADSQRPGGDRVSLFTTVEGNGADGGLVDRAHSRV